MTLRIVALIIGIIETGVAGFFYYREVLTGGKK